jgi:uncharacterized protein YodC (DUF2158 family)
METFKIGDIVRLKVGGPKMTIFTIVLSADQIQYLITCHWFDKNDILYQQPFDSIELVKVI